MSVSRPPKIVPNLKLISVTKSSKGSRLACTVISQAVKFAQGNMKGLGYKKVERERCKVEALSFLRGTGAWSKSRNHWCSVAGIELTYMRRKLAELNIVKYKDFVMGVEV